MAPRGAPIGGTRVPMDTVELAAPVNTPRIQAAPVLVVAAALGGATLPVALSAQIARSTPPRGASEHTVVPGARYDAGGLKRWFLGGAFRDVWTAPLEVPVLDLDFAGGLDPVGTGGYGQTFTLEFRGADGLEYAVRSLDKDPTRRLEPELQGTVVAAIVQDQTAAFLPTAGLVVDPLIEAAGLLHPKHRLVVVPDDPRLGEFRADYAGLIGMLVDRPQEREGGRPGFGGSERIVGTDTFLDALEEGACDRADAREYLEARLLDMLIGDRDRHAGQWSWARYPDGGDCFVWRPIPEDRDQAFIVHDGFMMSVYRRIRPQQVKFGPDYPSLLGLTFNGWELDRRLLVELPEDGWVEVAEEVQREITDAVIEGAVRRLPPEHYALRGEFLERALKTRRDALREEALDYYRMITRQPAITATDRDERAVFEHLPNGDLVVSIAYLGGPRSDTPWFTRTFHRGETSEVRLYLQGGDDRVEVRGGDGDIRVRAIGGGGDDRFVNASEAGRGLTKFYDARGDNAFEGRASVDRRPFVPPPSTNLVHREALDWGGMSRTFPVLSYSPDLGLYAGATAGFTRYGFRKVPWSSDHSLRAGITSTGPEFLLGWDARFRERVGGADGLLRVEYSGIRILHFYGFGNETPLDGTSSFFNVEQRELVVAPGLEWTWGGRRAATEEESGPGEFRPRLKLGAGPVLKYADTPIDDNADRFIGTLDPAPVGIGGYGQLGGRAWFEIDARDNGAYPTSGVRLVASGTAYPAVWDVEDAFGDLYGALSTYLTAGSGRHAPTLALRAGGRKVWGDAPFHEAAYLGGGDDLRGYRTQRFAGDAMAFGNAEVRLPVARFALLFPTEFGLHGAADVGRVFFEGDPDDADTWHTAFGGGVWFSFLNRRQTLSASVLHGDDLTGVYVKAGLMF